MYKESKTDKKVNQDISKETKDNTQMNHVNNKVMSAIECQTRKHDSWIRVVVL
jgi:hypothetical protein